MAEPLLSIRGLTKHYPIRQGVLGRSKEMLRAVEDVSLAIQSGETVGLVGESGCGKTTAGRALLRLVRATAGTAHFRSATLREATGQDSADILTATPATLRLLRRDMQIIFQDPYSALNPRLTVGANVGEPLRANGVRRRSERRDLVAGALDAVGLPAGSIDKYPHEFSGGQRQRAVIARALTLDPAFIVADEAVSALDVSIQAQVLNILLDLQAERGLSFLFIAHDLSVVRYVSHRIAVMYLGRIVELAPAHNLFATPCHPYTEALMSAVPAPRPGAGAGRIRLAGDVPNPSAPPSGCPFHPRCRYAEARCRTEPPRLREIGPGHRTACHFAETLSLRPATTLASP